MSYIDIITDALDGNEVDWLLLLYKQWVVELQLISQDLTFENRHVTRSMVGSYIINDFQKITHRPIGGCSRDIWDSRVFDKTASEGPVALQRENKALRKNITILEKEKQELRLTKDQCKHLVELKTIKKKQRNFWRSYTR